MSGGFTCTSCGAHFATAERSSICPTCKNGLLTPSHAGGSPREVARAGGSTFSATGGAGWKTALVVGAGVVAVVLGFIYGPIVVDRLQHPSEPVDGVYTSELLGMTVEFEPGWRHIKDQDQTMHLTARMMAGGMALTPEQEAAIGEGDVRIAIFYRGGTSGDPEEGVFIALMDFDSELMRQALHEGQAEAAREAVGGMMRTAGNRYGLKMGMCNEETAPNGAPLVRCVGSATKVDMAAVVFYVYPTEGGMGMVLYMSQDSLDAAGEKAKRLISSMR